MEQGNLELDGDKIPCKTQTLKFSKSQIQDKEKELKREYRMLKEARKQSGVGWDNKRCMIEAHTDLWDNLMIASSLIPPFNMVTILYHANTQLLVWFFVVISKYQEIQEEIFSSL